MILWAAAVTFVAMAAPSESPEYRHLAQAEISAALRDCGLRDLSVFEEEGDLSNLITIADEEVNDAQLECAFHAGDRTRYVLLWNEAVSPRYYDLSKRLLRPRIAAAARSYFADRPELGPLPEREAGESDIDLARKLERFCGPGAAGFMTDEFGTLAMSPDWFSNRPYEAAEQDFECMWNAVTLADLPFGFIGNGKVAGED